jgi:hypothetical protein
VLTEEKEEEEEESSPPTRVPQGSSVVQILNGLLLLLPTVN